VTDESPAPDGHLRRAQAGKPQPPAESAENESHTCEMPCLAARERSARIGFYIAPPSLEPKASRLIGPPAPVSDQRDPPLPSVLPLVPKLVEDRPRYRHPDDSGVINPFLLRKTFTPLPKDGYAVPGIGKGCSLLSHSGVGYHVVVDDHNDV
jgi:hypothetical protein